MRTFGDLLEEMDLTRPAYQNFSNFSLERADHEAKILSAVERYEDWELLARLLQEPLILHDYLDAPTLYRKLQGTVPALIDYLSRLAPDELIEYQTCVKSLTLCYLMGGLKALECLLVAPEHHVVLSTLKLFLVRSADYGYLAVIERLLKIEPLKTQADFNENAALRMAAASGHYAVVQRLLEINSVKAKVAVHSNAALRMAAIGGHVEVAHLLLELPEVRDFYVQLDAEPYKIKCRAIHIIMSGFIRALWLELEKSGILKSIRNLQELEASVQAYLMGHNPCVHEHLFGKRELITGMLNQVLVLRDHGYLNHSQLEDLAPNKQLIEQSLCQDWTDNLNQFIGLPKILQHFEHSKTMRLTATRCLATWALSKQMEKDRQCGKISSL